MLSVVAILAVAYRVGIASAFVDRNAWLPELPSNGRAHREAATKQASALFPSTRIATIDSMTEF